MDLKEALASGMKTRSSFWPSQEPGGGGGGGEFRWVTEEKQEARGDASSPQGKAPAGTCRRDTLRGMASSYRVSRNGLKALPSVNKLPEWESFHRGAQKELKHQIIHQR